MTYGEIKEKIRDLGFEENSTMKEYQTIVKNAVQRALQFLFDDVVIELKGYYKRELSTEEAPWEPVRPEPITDDTPDERVLELPDNIIELAPLLASYYVWLEDDNVKATLYWNGAVAQLASKSAGAMAPFLYAKNNQKTKNPLKFQQFQGI